MPYLNLDPDYFDHEKTKRLELALGPMSAIIPIKLWALAAKSCPESGIFKGLSCDELEHLIGWSGEKGLCFLTLKRLGFIDSDNENIKIHNFLEHQGHLKAFRVRSIKANKKRWNKIKGNLIHPSAILKQSLSDPPYHTIPSHSLPNHTVHNRNKIPPSLEDVKAYCLERKNTIDPEYFIDSNTAKGWMIGKSKMKDWQATIRNWERRQYSFKPNNPTVVDEYRQEGEKLAQQIRERMKNANAAQ